MGFEKTYNLRIRRAVLWPQLTRCCCRTNLPLRSKFAAEHGDMTTQMNDYEFRVNKLISTYSSSLMNNTKWREVLDLVGKHGIAIKFSFIGNEEFLSNVFFPEDGVQGDHTKDCCVHGPFYLKEIFAIKCAKYETKRNPISGAKYLDDTTYQAFLLDINRLGKLPLTVQDDHLIIYGYQK